MTSLACADAFDAQPDAVRVPLAEVGYITPKIGADTAIFNERGELLLMERVDGTRWCLPCGWNAISDERVTRQARDIAASGPRAAPRVRSNRKS
jgi:hypothetical protein